MNNVFVYCEIEDGQVLDVSLELLTKGRELANRLNCKLEAIVLGSDFKNIGEQVFPYGVDVLQLVNNHHFKEKQYDLLANHLRTHLDMNAIYKILNS